MDATETVERGRSKLIAPLCRHAHNGQMTQPWCMQMPVRCLADNCRHDMSHEDSQDGFGMLYGSI
jgi:hypothetical protein